MCLDILETFSTSVSLRSLITHTHTYKACYVLPSVYQFIFCVFPLPPLFTVISSEFCVAFSLITTSHHPLLYLFFHFLAISKSLCHSLCFPTQEASVVPWDHHCSSSWSLLPWFFMPGVQHAYPLTGLTLIWGQKHQNNNLPSPHLLILTLWSLFHCL